MDLHEAQLRTTGRRVNEGGELEEVPVVAEDATNALGQVAYSDVIASEPRGDQQLAAALLKLERGEPLTLVDRAALSA